MHVPCWSCLHKGSHQPITDREQQPRSSFLFHFQACYQAQNFPPPWVAQGELPLLLLIYLYLLWLSKLQAVCIKKGKVSSAASPSQKPHVVFFFSPYSFFQYLESRPLTADTVLIFLFSVIPSVAAVPSPLHFEAVRLMLKKPASVSYHELSQASF